MTTEQPRLLQQRGWLGKGTSQWERQNGSWMLMPTLRSSSTGHPVCSIMNTYVKWWSSMLLPPARVSMTALSTVVGRNHQQNETWEWNPLPWSSSTLTPPGRTLWTSTGKFISFIGCLEGVTVKRRQKNALARTSWIPSKNAFGVNGHLHHWRAGQRWSPAGTPSPGPHTRFTAAYHANYERFTATKQDSCREVLAMVRDTHWRALVAVALLVDRIERMGHSLSHQHSGSHQNSGSHQWRRSQTMEHQTEVPQVMSCHGDTAKRSAQSPIPPWPRWWVTFAKGWTPSSSKNSPGKNTRIGRAHWLPYQPGKMRGHQMTNLTGPGPKWKKRETSSAHPLWSLASRSSWVERRYYWLAQEWRVTSSELQCLVTPNLPPWKMWNKYSGTLNR